MDHTPGHLLMLAHRIPYPPDKGDKIRSFHQFKFFTELGWKVHVCTFADDPDDLQHIPALEEYCQTLAVFALPSWRQKLSMGLALLGQRPLSVGAFYLPKAQQHVNRILTNYPIQAVFCFCAPMAEYIFRSSLNRQIVHSRNRNDSTTQRLNDSTNPPKTIMDLVDVDSQKWSLYASNNKGFKRFIYNLEHKRLAGYERKILQTFDATTVVSEAEADQLRMMNGHPEAIHAVGNGVDLAYFHPVPEQLSDPHTEQCRLVFCGQMDYSPNVDAMVWFVDQVLPRLQTEKEKVHLTIVGARPAPEVLRLANIQGVTVTGRVDDVRPFLEKAHISIAPIRMARGIQNKVLEAMAMSRPVVATEQAYEGLEAKPGQDLLVTKAEPEAFAQAVLELWSNPDRAVRMGQKGRKRVEEHYSWPVHLAPLGRLLASK